MTAEVPKSQRKPKEIVSTLAWAHIGTNCCLTQSHLSFFEPLHELLAEKEWLIAETLTSLDCLAIGYLALDADAATTTRLTQTRHEGDIHNWVSGRQRSYSRTFERPIDLGHTLSPLLEGNEKGEHSLPWQAQVRPTLATIASTYWTIQWMPCPSLASCAQTNG
jgi:hypothetical protein